MGPLGYARAVSGRDARGDGDRQLIEAGMILASELSLDAVLLRIVELAVDLTDARYGALGVLTPDGRMIEEFITVGITPRSEPPSATLPPATASWGPSSPRPAPFGSPISARIPDRWGSRRTILR